MRTNFQKYFIMVFLLLITIAGAMAANVSGNETAAIGTMIGQMHWSFTFKLDETMGTTKDATYKGKVSENEIKITRQVDSWATEEATAKCVP
jgi:hypothetical protein